MALEYTEEKLNSLDKETVIRLFLAQQTQLKQIDHTLQQVLEQVADLRMVFIMQEIPDLVSDFACLFVNNTSVLSEILYMAVYLFRIDTTLLLMGIILVLFSFPVTLIVAGEFSDKSPYFKSISSCTLQPDS